jgi:hypothetical protein
MDEKSIIEHGSNISGMSLLLNVEKISSSIDIDDMERKVKNMYIEVANETEAEAEEEGETDILNEYEQAMEEIESVIAGGDNHGSNDHDEDDGDDDDEDDDDDDDDNDDDDDDDRPVVAHNGKPADSLYARKTRDEHLQSSISRVMETVPNMNIDMEQEIEEERKNSLLEQIEALRDDLGELGVSIDGSQYYVSYDAPLKRIEEVHRRLGFRYNKLKYNSIAEEALVAGASLLEMVFNGKHEYFGCRPDITGYSDVVKSKLKRIRVETSTAVSRFVAKNNVGVAPRLMMELLPSLITQSQRRKLQVGDSLNANVGYKKNSIRGHISDLNNMIPG